ncbi:hypothetical protein B0H16DRAFT_48587 [Mycena metata]|uniref:MYND-type domain-containing protein n=1 Tax=Mycena metata TaxID=1033252 RepID=A0AAD7NTS3_9AGAR|nr:hypothetical protein B0H16DRAFT_48587 [Mycena metata]
MHPVLQLGDLEGLPFSMRRTILTAARGVTKDVEKLQDLMEKVDGDSPLWDFFLPVYYANLDPARIPRGDRLDLHSTFTDGAVVSAHRSLEAIISMVMTYGGAPPHGAFPDLWVRGWQWIIFFDTFRGSFPGDDIAGSPFMILANNYAPEHKALLYSTPGFFRVFGASWQPLLGCGNPLRVALGIDAMNQVLFTNLRPTVRQHIDELIEGAGSLTGLARCVVGVFDQITADGETAVLKRERRLLGSIFDFIDDVDRILTGKRADDRVLGPFIAALIDCQITGSLTALAGTLGKSKARFNEFFPILKRSLMFLDYTLGVTADREAFMDAHSAGFLPMIICCGSHGQFNDTLKSLLEDVLPSSLIHYNELCTISETLHVAKLAAAQPPFQTSGICDAWTKFLGIVEERIKIMASLDSPGPRVKACDNAKCCKIADSALFQRCSNCLGFYYCSPECQEADWHDGAHRSWCNLFHSLRLSERQPLAHRERAFLRAVLTHDYTAAKLDIYREQVLRMPTTDNKCLITLFDYRAGRVRIELHPLDSPLSHILGRNASGGDESGWWNDVERAAESAGRMHLHVMALPSGGSTDCEPRYLLVPLRTETSTAHDMMVEIAASVESDPTSGAGSNAELELELVRSCVGSLSLTLKQEAGRETY